MYICVFILICKNREENLLMRIEKSGQARIYGNHGGDDPSVNNVMSLNLL